MAPEQKFCTGCGAGTNAVPQTTPQTGQQPQREKKKSSLLALAAIALVAAALFYGRHFLPGESGSSLYPAFDSDGNVGYIDRAGNVVVPTKFGGGNTEMLDLLGDKSTSELIAFETIFNSYAGNEYFVSSADGSVPVFSGGKCGYVDTKGNAVIDAQFDSCEPFVDGVAVVTSGDKRGVIDQTGRVVAQPQYDTSWLYYTEGKLVVQSGDKSGFIDKTGAVAVNIQYDDVLPFTEGMAAVEENDKWGFIDSSGTMAINPQYDDVLPFTEDVAAVRSGQQWEFINKNGSAAISAQFDRAWSFMNGLAAVESGGQYGYIDHKGNYVIQPQFQFALPFTGDYACVQSGGKWGYIDKKGAFVIPPQFDKATPFEEGLAAVKSGDSIAYIDDSGKVAAQLPLQSASSSGEPTTVPEPENSPSQSPPPQAAAFGTPSIAFGYDRKTNEYYYFSLDGGTLYYFDSSKRQWVNYGADPFPAPSGFISIYFFKDGTWGVNGLGSDGYQYELSTGSGHATWTRRNEIAQLSGTPSTFCYFYDDITGQWFDRALANGRFMLLSSPDSGQTWSWSENTTIEPLSGDGISMAGAADDKGTISLYAMSQGTLYLLETKDKGQSWYWSPMTEVQQLSGPPAAITYYYASDWTFRMFAVQGDKIEELVRDPGNASSWHWEDAAIPSPP